MDDSPFLIVGGGIAGLAAALGLSNNGQSSIVLEKAAAIEAVGAGLQLGPNAVSALQHLGAWDAVSPHCAQPNEIHICDGVSGKLLQRVDLGTAFENRFGAPYRVALRSDLQHALLETARQRSNIVIRTNAEVVTVSTVESSVSLNSGDILKGTAIVAADGVHSRIRKQINGRDGYGRFGHMLFRGLIPTAILPTTIALDVVTLWLHPGGHVVHYSVGNGKFLNVVASLEDSEGNPAQLFRAACQALQDVLQLKPGLSPWPAFEVEGNAVWSEGNTVLVGDAAHASLPYLAQGAAMALEDACELAQAISGAGPMPDRLNKFSRRRRSRTVSVQRKSRQLGTIYHAGGAMRLARNAVLQLTSPARFLNQLAWIYDWKCK